MAITATNNGGGTDFEPIPAGSYPARCYSMIHIGTNTENLPKGMQDINKVRITWELPTELKEFKEGEGEKPMSISKDYTLSMHEKANLRKDLDSWRGKAFTEDEASSFDITKLIGVECMLSVIHKSNKKGTKTYATVTGVSSVPKGMVVPEQINESFVFSYEDEWDDNKFNSLPDWIKEKVKTSKEYIALKSVEGKDFIDEVIEEQDANADEPPF